MTAVLVVAAHPDDAELAMAMRIHAHVRSGDAVRVHCLTIGTPDPDGSEPRREEALRAGAVLGVGEYTFSPVPDTRFVEHRALVRDEVTAVIEDARPDLVYTHFPHDQHLDHRVAGEETTAVALGHVRALTHFRAPYSTGFDPTSFFLATEELMAVKVKALACFGSQAQLDMRVFHDLAAVSHHQHVHRRVLDAVDPRLRYAESFRIVRELYLSEVD
ncbi:PIG-L deacetylase family protein [Lentzea sp. E54]|uniref:PIG-L deacetylase family protein n=1 Tax=Lentzea xerophila TaxID=3435883 RepID=UPI003DA5ADF8